MNDHIKNFFANSDGLDHMALRPLSHILPNWELTWNKEKEEYLEEEGSFAGMLNELIIDLAQTTPPAKYHDNEDILAEYVKNNMKWPIEKIKGKWGIEGYLKQDYASILEQGAFDDEDQKNLIKASAGRVHDAIKHGKAHFDDMELGHRQMLAAVIAIILYHRSNELGL